MRKLCAFFALFGIGFFVPHVAFAATNQPVTAVDISTITNVLLSTISVVVLALVKPVCSALSAHLKISQNSALYAQGCNEIEGLGQLVITELTSVAAHNPTMALPGAVGKILAGIEPISLKACTVLGWTPENISARISGWVIKELGLTPEPLPEAVKS